LLLNKYFPCVQIREDETCKAYREEENCIQDFGWGTRDLFECPRRRWEENIKMYLK
jgi:hypothetical protein